MSIEGVATIVPAQLVQPTSDREGLLSQLVVDEILELTVDAIDNEGVMARSGDNRLLRLGNLQGSLSLGDLLFLRVVSTSPSLELALLKSAPARAPHESPVPMDSESAAMRLDQAAILRHAVPVQEAGTLALSWRTMVSGYLERQIAMSQLASGQRVPGSLFGSDVGASLLREAPRVTPGAEIAPWAFSAYVWAGSRLLLSMMVNEEDEAKPRKRRHRNITLRLHLMLPGAGMAMLQLREVAGGILLDLAAEEGPALKYLRRALRRIFAAVARADLRLMRCSLAHVLPDPGRAVGFEFSSGGAMAQMFSPALFRAAAELALLLSQPARNELADGADDADLPLLGDLVIR